MPFADDEVRLDLACGPDAAGRWRGYFTVHVCGEALWGLGLHPDQPMSRLLAGPLPAWWHASVERSWRRSGER